MSDLLALKTAAAVDSPSSETLLLAQARLEAEYASRPTMRRRRRGVVVGAAVIAVSAAAAIVALPTVIPGSGHRPVGSADAATFLHGVAVRAAAQDVDAKDAAFWYAHSLLLGQTGQVEDRQIWLGHNASGRLIQPMLSDGDIPPLGVAAFPAGGASLSWDQLWTLPTDADALEHFLRAHRDGAGSDANSELFTEVGDILRESPAPPALRAALYEVAAAIPGVELVGEITDPEGRQGVEVRRAEPESDGAHLSYVIDPKTGALLDEADGTAGCATFLATSRTLVGGPSNCIISVYLEHGPVATDHSTP